MSVDGADGDMHQPHPSPLASNPPDILHNSSSDARPPTPPRRDTMTSNAGTDGGKSERGADTCRICRSEGTPEEPLFYPCKCSGSIKHVHQECLMEWLSHSHKKHCELCKTPFHFTKLYDAHMPTVLPWSVFVERASLHFVWGLLRWLRLLLVASVWLCILPWIIRWAWRWMFWFIDAGWARETFVHRVRNRTMLPNGRSSSNKSVVDYAKSLMPQILNQSASLKDAVDWTKETLDRLAMDLFKANVTRKDLEDQYQTASIVLDSGRQLLDVAEGSTTTLLSDWKLVAEATNSPIVNRVMLDIFEGLVITATVIIGFILVFLIREWVVQQQPLADLRNVQGQLRDVADRIQEENERIRRQQLLLGQARQRLQELQDETPFETSQKCESKGTLAFEGWQKLNSMIDHANDQLRKGNSGDYALFLIGAQSVARQMVAARIEGISAVDVADRVTLKLSAFSQTEREDWRSAILDGIEDCADSASSADKAPSQRDEDDGDAAKRTDAAGEASRQRPRLQRDLSSKAADIQRLLQEAEATDEPSTESIDRGTGDNAMAENVDARDRGLSDTQSNDISIASIESWQHVAPPRSEPQVAPDARDFQAQEEDGQVAVDDPDLPLPITNAGPDAKINIKRSGKRGLPIVPEPTDEDDLMDAAFRKKLEKLELRKIAAEHSRDVGDQPLFEEASGEPSRSAEEPSHDDDPRPEAHNEEDTLSNRVASAFKEEFGLSEAEEAGDLRQAGPDADGERAPNQQEPEDRPPHLPDIPTRRGPMGRLSNYFWGDLEPRAAADPTPPADEVRTINDTEAPFVPVVEGQLVTQLHVAQEDAEEEPLDEAEDQPEHGHDPEVVAAAQQAGLDAEAVEDAEDLEGIFELIGMQGPIVGLFQTAMFCTILTSVTILGAVGVPYAWGKFVLSFIGSPMAFLVKMPLQFASFVTDFILDATLFLFGSVVVVASSAANAVAVASRVFLPEMRDVKWLEKIVTASLATSVASSERIQNMFVTTAEVDSPLGVHWLFLLGSAHAHQSLRDLEAEFRAVFAFFGNGTTATIEAISHSSLSALYSLVSTNSRRLPAAPGRIAEFFEMMYEQYLQPTMEAAHSLKTNGLTLTLKSSDRAMDPALIFWDATDRSLAVLVGYLALAVVAAIYVAADTPITNTESGRKTEKIVRDTLRQAGGVLKVIIIISIEMLVFPLYCGMLLDFAFLPLFADASVGTRLAFAARAPATFCFMHWITGTAYMFHFALFVGMCRKILRKGVLWFIRDPDDPTFHPVRDVLERSVVTQLRKIAFSALVYGALVILCLGGVVWGIGKAANGIFPLQWVATEPILEFPMDLLLYNFVTPLVVRLLKPSDAVQAMYAWWLKLCARGARLSHFLFDVRHKDEEGSYLCRPWISFLLGAKPDDTSSISVSTDRSEEASENNRYGFKRDGKYALTPCNDQYRPPKPGEAFLHVSDDDVYIADKDGKKNEQFTKVYIPPHFRTRIAAFMICLWLFSAFIGLCATLVPLAFGRGVLKLVGLEKGMNDIYAYTIGAYTLGIVLSLARQQRSFVSEAKEKLANFDTKKAVQPVQTFVVRAAKCCYVYGFLGVVLPAIFALLLHFYIVLPLHTYAAFFIRNFWMTSASAGTSPASNSTASIFASVADNSTNLPITALRPDHSNGSLVHHSIHIFQDYALGLLYLRIAFHVFFSTPTSRFAEAFRRITVNGYLDPSIALTTRYFILPTVLISALLLFMPLGIAKLAIETTTRVTSMGMTDIERTKLYRYAYPMAAGWILGGMGIVELGAATLKWRARIRDEVYLVGERLHNLGEKRPPTGSKSVVRKDR